MGKQQNPIIINSWYVIEKDLKRAFILFSILCVVALVITCITQTTEIMYGLLGGISTTVVTIPFSIKQKDTASQWEKYVHTLPMTKTDIVKSQFRFFEQTTLMFTSFVVIMLGITLLLPLEIAFEQVVTIFIMPISIGIVGQSLVYALSLKFSAGINDIFLMFSIIISIIPTILPITVAQRYFESNAILAYIILSLLLIIVIEYICYLLCTKFMKEKEF